MRFRLIDEILEHEADRLVAIKNVTLAEEYLADHFPSFPVLPGVLMLEALVQAARALLGPDHGRMVLGTVGPTKYGTFVKPGESLRVEVSLLKRGDHGTVQFKGHATVLATGRPQEEELTCVSSRFTMRPLTISIPTPVFETA